MLNTRFSGWPAYTAEEVEAVSNVLRSNRVNYWTGEECRRFESEFAAWAGASHAVSVANGTLALDLALKALDIGPGADVVVTPRSFVASASCVVTAGARPVFADVDPDSQNITAQTIGQVITERTRAIVCVHLAGWPCEMDEILALARKHGIAVIEDCAQAHGASYKGRSVGSLGDVGAWSFCQDKIITTGGEGGMVTTSDRELWSRMWSYKDHGKSWEAVYERQHPPGFRWLHESFGTNWRMLEMQAVLGRIQLRRIQEWCRLRTRNAEAIAATCRSFPALRVPRPEAHCVHAYYRLYAFIRPSEMRPGWDRDRVIAEINALGVPCYQGSCSEMYRELAFVNAGIGPVAPLPEAVSLGESSLMFLVHPSLTEAEIEQTCRAVESVMTACSR
jgi:dTDP-4-amino-4,6-dideoxygalactose transaminase